MSDLYTKIDQMKLDAATTTSEVAGLPPGYVSGFAMTLTDGRIVVGPGIANVQGRQVEIPEERYILDSEWVSKAKLASTVYYIYLSFAGAFFVDLVAPSFITGQYGNYHPTLGYLYIGKAKTDTSADISLVASQDAIIASQADFEEIFTISAQSPDYVAGVSGWAIFSDGSAEFNDVEVRGAINDKVTINETEVIISGDDETNSLRTRLTERGVYIEEYDSGVWGETAHLIQKPGPLAASDIHLAFEDDVTDSSGNGVDGTAYGTPTYTAGQVGQAISLNGTSQYVTLPNAADRLYCGAGLDWTVGVWIYPLSYTNYPIIITKMSSSGTILNFDIEPTEIYVVIRGSSTSVASTAQLNQWNHIAISWDGTTAKLYKNATFVSNLNVGSLADSTAHVIGIGTSITTSGTIGVVQFPGYIDEFRIVPTSTLAGVQDLYNNGAPGSTELDVDAVVADTVTAATSISTPAISAPNGDIFAARAWVNFDGTTDANVSGTYARSGTTVTVTLAGHGQLTGHVIYANFTSGTATDGIFTVTGATTDTFTFTHGTSGTTSGNVTLNRREIRASGNVSNVAYLAAGKYFVNFTTAMADANYAAIPGFGRTAANWFDRSIEMKSNECTAYGALVYAGAGTATFEDQPYITLSIFR